MTVKKNILIMIENFLFVRGNLLTPRTGACPALDGNHEPRTTFVPRCLCPFVPFLTYSIRYDVTEKKHKRKRYGHEGHEGHPSAIVHYYGLLSRYKTPVAGQNGQAIPTAGHSWTSKLWPDYGQYGRKYGRQAL